MLVCPKGKVPRRERELEQLKRGELRWSDRDGGWEVFIPCAAFKNAGSAYFSKKPFRLVLPDLGGLYAALRKRGHSHARALRSIGSRLIGVACAMLSTGELFDAARQPQQASA